MKLIAGFFVETKPEFGPAGQVPVMPMTTHGFGSRGPRRAVDKTKTRYDDMTTMFTFCM